MLARAVKLRKYMQQCTFSNVFIMLQENRDPTKQAKAHEVKGTLMDDELWEHVSVVVQVVKPLAEVLDFCNGDYPGASKVYQKMFDVSKVYVDV